MNQKTIFRQCKLFFRNRAINETVENMICCIHSGNLAEKQLAFGRAIKGTVKIFTQEIGRLGGGSIREILKTQEIYHICSGIQPPFSTKTIEGRTCLQILLGELPYNDEILPMGIAFSEYQGKWYYTGKAGSNLIFSDVLEFTSEEIKISIRILSSSVIILNQVYNTPDGPMDIFVTRINEMHLAIPDHPLLLTEQPPLEVQ